MGTGPSPEALKLYAAAQRTGGGESMRDMSLQERMSESAELRRRDAIVRGYLAEGKNIDGMPFSDHTGKAQSMPELRRENERMRAELETLRAVCRALLEAYVGEDWKEKLEEMHE